MSDIQNKMKDMLKRHEGLKTLPYLDTVGKLTIGYGRNLDDKGLTKDECDYLFNNDYDSAKQFISTRFPAFSKLNEARQEVLINMAFNMRNRIFQFKKMLSAIEQGDFNTAADQMLKSKWALQVGNRAAELAAIMRTGKL